MARPSRKGGKTSEAKARNAPPQKSRKTTKAKPRIAPAATRVKRRSVSNPSKDLEEAREQQAATAEILKVIASSPNDVQPVFDAIAASSHRLVGGYSTSVLSLVDDMLRLSAFTPTNPSADAALIALFPRPLSGETWNDRIRNGETVEIPDIESDPIVPEGLRETWLKRGLRSLLLVPLVRSQKTIGIINVTRKQPGAFAPHHVQLLQTFADQAVIAIENVRLFDEVQAKTRDLTEALVYQTGSSNILKVIASSPTDVQPVLKAIVESASELCEAYDAAVLLREGDNLRFSAHYGPIPIGLEKWPINRRWTAGRAFIDQKPVHIHDLRDEVHAEFTDGREMSLRMGHRSILSVPLLREGESIGSIVLRRTEVHPFSDKQITLLQTFADQAVIAIENTRLFNETQEALERQTATADILKVIASSPDDVQPVFQAIAYRSNQLVNALSTTVFKLIDGVMHLQAFTATTPEADASLLAMFPAPLSAFDWGDSIRRGEIYRVIDVEKEFERMREVARLRGWRSMLAVPLLRDGKPIGMIGPTRAAPGPFSDHHVQLLQTFADQAVIAIENVRLFDEVQAKTRDLSEALTYQTGTSNILSVIASSPTDVGPVLNAIVESTCELCEAYDAVLRLKAGDELVYSAQYGTVPSTVDAFPIDPKLTAGRALLEKRAVHVHDMLSAEGDEFPIVQELARHHGHRTVLSVPLLRENEGIGTITLRRLEVNPFGDKQIDLLQTFANQAVIAIGNVRMFEEVQARTRDLTESLEQQTATSEVLEVISSSPGELQPVFQKMLENATRVCEANFGIMNLWDGEQYHIVADHNIPPAFASYREQTALRPHSGSLLAAIVKTHRAAQLHDMRESPGYLAGIPMVVRLVDVAGARTVMVVPMVKEDALVGAITIFRQEVRPFTDKQIALVENFTKQAVIAIENTRLLKELRERTNDLTRSLEELRAAQDRLIQTEKLASLGQLTAGIAHEIKNPLNFVNNFSALSAELTHELNDVLKPVAMDDQVRGEVDELTGLLKSNLEKVVQHGKRADSIVKNMLLHSREGSREHRAADINSLLDESLNLAYHGARAEKGEFNITLQRDFDADAGTIELFPQEITRAFLNLIANGVYAATRRKTEDKEPGFEPTLWATTKNLGATVEIRIRDNGTGIPAEVQEKMFNPFFTTKPAGEGTGLGLSMTHDIIVKQHGGRIDVATEPGQFTEFIIVLPRMTATGNTGADK